MAYEFKLPDLGEGLTEGEVARWLVAEGDEIAEDEPLVEIQTDKTTVEIPSPAAGPRDADPRRRGRGRPGRHGARRDRRRRRRAAGRASGAAGTSCGRVSGTASTARPDGPGDAARAPDRRGARRRPRRRSRRPGPGGRITEEDVRGAAGGASWHGTSCGGRREPVRGVRRQIVEHLTRAHREMPAVTYVEECDFTGVDLKQLVPLVLRATAQSLQEFPELNARLEGDEIVYLDRYDLGVAVQTDAGARRPGRARLRRALARGAARRRRRARREGARRASSSRRSCAGRRSPSRAPASSPGSS